MKLLLTLPAHKTGLTGRRVAKLDFRFLFQRSRLSRTTCLGSAGALAATVLTFVSFVLLQPAPGCLARDSDDRLPEPTLNAFEIDTAPGPETKIDKLVFEKFKQLNIRPVFSSDAVFVRRAFLDVIGTLPTTKEARDFILDQDTKNKRRRLIDELLERPEFADYWAMKWSDILRIKAEFPVNLWPEAAQKYHHWVRASIAENKPYDKFVRELLTASGSNFCVGQANFYRAIQNRTPEGIAGAVALTFMGSRIASWTADTAAGMASLFSEIGYKPTRQWKEEIVFWDPLRSAAAQSTSSITTTTRSEPATPAVTDKSKRLPVTPAEPDAGRSPATTPAAPETAVATPLPVISPLSEAIFPDGTRVKLPENKDPREIFADWLITSKNPWFKRALVNRVWYWLMGRGIIQEADDIRPDNPPGNPALLSYLEKEFTGGHYDLKHLYRLILNSQTYQLSSTPRYNAPEAEVDFASYPLRRLDAEVLIDAINKVTGTSDHYTSPIPEPFTYIPEDMPATGIGDGSITSPFLSLFGRSARNTGMENERSNKPVPAQWLHMLNSSHIQRKLEQGPKLKAIIDSGHKPSAITEELYLTILSRFPTAQELKIVDMYGTNNNQLMPGNYLNFSSGGPNPGTSRANIPNISVGAVPFPAVPPGKKQQQAPPGRQRKDWIDIAWGLINSMEFLYRH